tara:strand:+ start:127 stop:1527 length:1401 start_codon:yes stop_codon:yes gene_type:complete
VIERNFIKYCINNLNQELFHLEDKKISNFRFLGFINDALDILKKRKIKKGNKVIIKIYDQFFWIIFYIAIKLYGAIPILVNPKLKKKIISKICRENQSNYLITNKDIFIFKKNINKKNLIKFKKKNLNNKISDYNLKKNSISEIIYTSGSTNEPKGVMLTNSNINYIASQINKVIKINKNDFELLSLPLFHSFGLGRLRCFMLKPHKIALNENASNIAKNLVLIGLYKINIFSLVPSSIEIYKKFNKKIINQVGNLIKKIELGSEKISAVNRNWLLKNFKKSKIFHHYGMTEASRSAFKIYSNKKKYPINYTLTPGVKIKISNIRKKNNNKKLGEILLKGRSITNSYVNKNLNNQKFIKKYLKTGDIGEINIKKKKFKLLGRIDRNIKISGINVNLDSLENLIKKNFNLLYCDSSLKNNKIILIVNSKNKILKNKIISYVYYNFGLKISIKTNNYKKNSGKIKLLI